MQKIILREVRLNQKSENSETCGSCTAEVEFEFTTWVAPKATADFIPAVADPVFYCLFMYANEWWEKNHCWNGDQQWPPLLIVVPELKLKWWTQSLPRPNKKQKTGILDILFLFSKVWFNLSWKVSYI